MTDPLHAAAVVVAAIAAAGVTVWVARRRRARRWADKFANMPHLCMRCGQSLPLVFFRSGGDDATEIVVIEPLGVACPKTGIAGMLCSRDCARAWNEQHMAIHHPEQEHS